MSENIIVNLSREIRRVLALYPRLNPRELERAMRTVHFANVGMTRNSDEAMKESLEDLKLITDPKK